MPVMEFFNVPATARASFACYSRESDIDALVARARQGTRGIRLMDLKDLYREVILDHNKTPAACSAGSIRPTSSADGHNPLCGDRLHVTLRLEGDRVADLRFEGKGCAISVASASMMCEAVKGKRRDEIDALFNEIHEVLTRHDAPVPEDLGKLAALSGVREFPVRVKCASLCLAHAERRARAQRRTVQDRIDA